MRLPFRPSPADVRRFLVGRRSPIVARTDANRGIIRPPRPCRKITDRPVTYAPLIVDDGITAELVADLEARMTKHEEITVDELMRRRAERSASVNPEDRRDVVDDLVQFDDLLGLDAQDALGLPRLTTRRDLGVSESQELDVTVADGEVVRGYERPAPVRESNDVVMLGHEGPPFLGGTPDVARPADGSGHRAASLLGGIEATARCSDLPSDTGLVGAADPSGCADSIQRASAPRPSLESEGPPS